MLNTAAWKYYWRLYNGAYQQLLFCVLMTIAQILPIIALAFLLRKLFDTILPAKNLKYILLICLAMIVLSLITMGMTLLTQKKAIRIVTHVILRLREELLHRFYLFSQRFYTNTDLNRLHTCMTLDSERIDLMSQSLIIRLIPAFIISIALSMLMLYMNWLLFLCLISVTPLLLIFAAIAKNRLKMQTKKYHQAFEKFSKGVLFILQMMELTRIQSAETFEVERQTANLVDVGNFSQATTWYSSLYQQLNNFIEHLC